MRIWLALVAAPVLALADQSISLSLAGWGCMHHLTLVPHVVHIASLLLAAGSAAAAFLLWRATASARRAQLAVARRHFLAGAATAVGFLSALAIAAMWIPNWMLSPCIA